METESCLNCEFKIFLDSSVIGLRYIFCQETNKVEKELFLATSILENRIFIYDYSFFCHTLFSDDFVAICD